MIKGIQWGMFMNCWLIRAFKVSRYIAMVWVACPF